MYVYLFILHLQVRLIGKLVTDDDVISVANIFFKSGLCQALPVGFQGWFSLGFLL